MDKLDKDLIYTWFIFDRPIINSIASFFILLILRWMCVLNRKDSTKSPPMGGGFGGIVATNKKWRKSKENKKNMIEI